MASFLQSLLARTRDAGKSEDYPITPPPADLGSLGILEIRPKTKTTEEPEPDSSPSSPENEEIVDDFGEEFGDGIPVEIAEDESDDLRGRDVISIRARESVRTLAVESVADPLDEAFMIPCLSAVRAALEAHTVCLLLQDGSANRYRIVGTVSRSGYARTAGRFMTKRPIFPDDTNDTIVVLTPPRDSKESVRYYREKIAVKEMIVAALEVHGQMYFLVADSMHTGVFGSEYKLKMLRQAVYFLRTYLLHKAEQDGLSGDSIVIRPRREIIADEITIARRTQRPLALALVYLNNAEQLSKKGSETVEGCERVIRERLYRHTPHGRIEQFGELTFGVFLPGDVHDAEEWVLNMQNILTVESAEFDEGISVGVAMLRDRHKTPQEFRADATAALQEAFETGSCTILE